MQQCRKKQGNASCLMRTSKVLPQDLKKYALFGLDRLINQVGGAMTHLVLDEYLHIVPVAAFFFGIGAFVVPFVFYQPVKLVELVQLFDVVDRCSTWHITLSKW